MANDVFANGREISCKAADGKAVAAFPDVCMTPPENPTTPPGVPVPYPNTGMAKDATSGSKSVKISRKEVMLKNKSYFKKSMGDEAGSAAKKGVVTSVNRGKVYFKAWSMDVKFEGQNVVRHLDLTTHNHASDPGQTPPWPYADGASVSVGDPCKKEKRKVQKHCNPEKDWKKNCPTPPPAIGPSPGKGSPAMPAWQANNKARLELFDDFSQAAKKNNCLNARKCMLVSKSQSENGKECCPGQTGDHLIEGASFVGLPEWGAYSYSAAPTVCAEGPSWHTGSHRDLSLYRHAATTNLSKGGKWSRKKATRVGAKSLRMAFPRSGCSQKCIEAQLNNYHDGKCSVTPETDINASSNAPKDAVLNNVAKSLMGF
ncbi:PAAR-like domain-containing protein [Halomonas heilongjiangensis]|uniref:Tox-GHH2 domain-containing protein n=1 Tax=Halomonas heilongjiangensis TaxID=1387883 RepID=A0A2N7TFR7_9GAMM|nr:PAAR-like domain-containing protein [Halomonas heilongjiangensis]PMR67009.1 hypothetical protein C1H66_21580 [Halomonas heilongjiangensis]PXX88075.1 hypothetical protein CR158_15395 [Halomonas heilongjiangensis]